MEKETKYREASVYATDNGYSVVFRDYRGPTPKKLGIKVAKTLDELKKILKDNFIDLVD